MIIYAGAPAQHRRIRGVIPSLDFLSRPDKGGAGARKIVNDVDAGGNWTNTLVYDSDTGEHYLELTEAELAALAEHDTASWAYKAADTAWSVAEKAQILSLPTLAEMLASAFTIAPAQISAGVLDATVVVTDGATLTVKQGDVKLYTFEFGAQWDCTGGKRIFFTVKKKATDASASISKEGTVTTPATAGGSLSLAAADTSALTPGEYVYEFKRRDADGVSSPGTIQEGAFIIGQDLS
jgi:hypothetical protein